MYLAGNENIFTSANDIARQMRNGKVVKIGWTYYGVKKHAAFGYIASAVLDEKSDLLVVALHFADKQYKRPANAVVINPDGTINHVVHPPEFVSLLGNSSSVERYAVEAIFEALAKNGRTLIGLNYRYEMIERRYYEVRGGVLRRQMPCRSIPFRTAASDSPITSLSQSARPWQKPLVSPMIIDLRLRCHTVSSISHSGPTRSSSGGSGACGPCSRYSICPNE